MSTPARNWSRAVVMAVAPVALVATVLYHPYLPGIVLTPESVALVAEADPGRWATAHLMSVGAVALLVLAFQSLRGRLRDAGEERWSSFAFPLVVVSAVLIGAVAAIELTVGTAALAGIDAVALSEAVRPWALTLLTPGLTAFLVGSLAFAVGIARADIMDRPAKGVVAVAMVVMALAVIVPASVAGYVLGVASIVVFWPLARATARAASASASATKAPPLGEAGWEHRRTAPRPRSAEEHRGLLRGLGRRGSRAHH